MPIATSRVVEPNNPGIAHLTILVASTYDATHWRGYLAVKALVSGDAVLPAGHQSSWGLARAGSAQPEPVSNLDARQPRSVLWFLRDRATTLGATNLYLMLHDGVWAATRLKSISGGGDRPE